MYGWPKPPLSPAQQFLFLSSNPICAGDGELTHRGLIWNYRVRPSLLSREYLIRLAYSRGDTPDVSVVNPVLSALAGDRKIPHVYRNPLRLCLYLPGSGEWTDTMRLDLTIVPWTATWLYYFEEWLDSDDWKGSGVHPGEDGVAIESRNSRRRARSRLRTPQGSP